MRGAWGLLAHGLSGIFCGSLNFLDSPEHIAEPALTFGSHAQFDNDGFARRINRMLSRRGDVKAPQLPG